jgi:hypothetical protein
MSEPSSKTSGKAVALLVIAAVAVAGAFFGISQWEKDRAQKIEEALREVSGSASKVTVGFWDKSVGISGLKIDFSYFGLGEASLQIDDFSASGLTFDALTSAAGVIPLADSVSLRNAVMIFTPKSAELPGQKTTLASLTAAGLTGDFAALLEAVRAVRRQPAFPDRQTLLRCIAVAKGFHMQTLSLAGYESSSDLPGFTVSHSLESYRIEDVGLLSSGAGIWENLKIRINNADFFSVDSTSVQRAAMPDIFTPFVSALPDRVWEQPTSEDVSDLSWLEGAVAATLQTLHKEPFLLRGFAVRDISLQLGGPELAASLSAVSQPVTLRQLTLDLEVSAKKFSLQHAFDDLSVPPFLAALLLPFSHDGGLLFSGSLEVSGAQHDDGVDVSFRNTGLREKTLGSCSLEAALLIDKAAAASPELLLQSPLSILCRQARITLVDLGVLDLFFASQYALLQQFVGQEAVTGGAADLRAAAADELRQAGDAFPPSLSPLLQEAVKLVERPGTLVIRLEPQTPQPLMNVDALRISAEYTPQTAGEAPGAAAQ